MTIIVTFFFIAIIAFITFIAIIVSFIWIGDIHVCVRCWWPWNVWCPRILLCAFKPVCIRHQVLYVVGRLSPW